VDELSEAIRLLVENINSKEIISYSKSVYGIDGLRIDIIYITIFSFRKIETLVQFKHNDLQES